MSDRTKDEIAARLADWHTQQANEAADQQAQRDLAARFLPGDQPPGADRMIAHARAMVAVAHALASGEITEEQYFRLAGLAISDGYMTGVQEGQLDLRSQLWDELTPVREAIWALDLQTWKIRHAMFYASRDQGDLLGGRT